MESLANPKIKSKFGSFTGLIISLLIGFFIYFSLLNINIVSTWLDYNTIVENAGKNLFYKIIWYIMNFSEAQFYAGVFASVGVILGGFIAWRLDLKDSKYAGFSISYGSNLWPWIIGSQLLTLFISIFLLNNTKYFNSGEFGWLPTFVMVVGAPPSIVLLYGPGLVTLLTASVLGAFIGFPVAFWIMTNIIPIIGVPGVVSNVFTMAITGVIIAGICNSLPWMKKVPSKPIKRRLQKNDSTDAMEKPSWFVRRVFADFSEAQFYGNEIAGALIIVGAIVDWILNSGHGAYASGLVPAIILSQIVGSAVGVYLYFNKYVENGWYATYVPVVSVGPACVLMFGGSIPIAVLAGVFGGIIGPPLAEYFASKLPANYHGTIANVTSMGVTTIVVSMALKVLF